MPEEVIGKLVDIRFRSGAEAHGELPSDYLWDHYGRSDGPGHIIAYRLTVVS